MACRVRVDIRRLGTVKKQEHFRRSVDLGGLPTELEVITCYTCVPTKMPSLAKRRGSSQPPALDPSNVQILVRKVYFLTDLLSYLLLACALQRYSSYILRTYQTVSIDDDINPYQITKRPFLIFFLRIPFSKIRY